MKVFIYFILIIAFLMFYQQKPVFTVIIVGLLMLIFVFFKVLKYRGTSAPKSFLSNFRSSQSHKNDDILTLLLLQQVINSESPHIINIPMTPRKINKHEHYIENIKQEILELLMK
jgi:c-di-AMP phosphodiesterase-like protein